MAQTRKQRRRTKHRGNAAGIVEARGRTGRKPAASEKGTSGERGSIRRRDHGKPPTWRSALNRAAISALVLFVALMAIFKRNAGTSFALSTVALAIYIPIGYFTDAYMYRRRLAQDRR